MPSTFTMDLISMNLHRFEFIRVYTKIIRQISNRYLLNLIWWLNLCRVLLPRTGRPRECKILREGYIFSYFISWLQEFHSSFERKCLKIAMPKNKFLTFGFGVKFLQFWGISLRQTLFLRKKIGKIFLLPFRGRGSLVPDGS